MSHWSTPVWEPTLEYTVVKPTVPFVEPLQRPLLQPILLLLPTVISIVAWAATSPMMTDCAFLVLAVLCAIFFVMELAHFSERFGIGGLVLYGGVLIWFCYDYFSHWFGAYLPTWKMPFSPAVVARSAMYHMIFITCMAVGIRIRWGKWLPKLMLMLPEPRNLKTYFWIVLATQVVGLFPYFIWNAEPFYLAIYHQIVAGRSGMEGAGWLYGRNGTVNTSYGAYIAQILQVGGAGALLAAFYAIFLTRALSFQSVVCWLIWLLWLALGFGTGTRGDVAFIMVPVVGFVFIRFHVEAAEVFRRFSFKAYVLVGLLAVMAVALIQIQIRFRNKGFTDADLSTVSYTQIEGNNMFSEGLMGFVYIPEQHDIFYSHFPGESIILPIPNSILWFLISPLPRAFFTDKPIDPVWAWYNDVSTGGSGTGSGKTEGTTVAEGLVGNWYFRYGLAGVIEGGLLMGWLMGCSERALINNRGRPMAVLFALGMATWIFRCYRDLGFVELDALLVGLLGISLLILILRPFSSAEAS